MWVSTESIIFDSDLLPFFLRVSDVMEPLLSCEIWKRVLFKNTVCFTLLFHVLKYISHIYVLFFGCLFVHEWQFAYMRDRKSIMCMCIYTPYSVVGAMVTHQVGSGVRAAVLHLLSETLLSPFSLSSLHPFPVVLYRQYTKKWRKKDFYLWWLQQTNWRLLGTYIEHFLLFIIYNLFWCSAYLLPLVVVWGHYITLMTEYWISLTWHYFSLTN